jgi:hypothetical protein
MPLEERLTKKHVRLWLRNIGKALKAAERDYANFLRQGVIPLEKLAPYPKSIETMKHLVGELRDALSVTPYELEIYKYGLIAQMQVALAQSEEVKNAMLEFMADSMGGGATSDEV